MIVLKLGQKRTCEGCAAIRNDRRACELGFNNRGHYINSHFGNEIKPQEPCYKPHTTREFIEAQRVRELEKVEL